MEILSLSALIAECIKILIASLGTPSEALTYSSKATI
jgi:hypothetical protein